MKVVFWGLGGLHWVRLDHGPFGPHWEKGNVGGWIGLAGGLRFGLDSSQLPGIHPALSTTELTLPPLPPAQVKVLAPGEPDAPIVPELPEVVRGLARWIGKQLDGAGLLVFPPGVDRDALWEWADLGWSLEPLPTEGSLVAFDGPLVRVGKIATARDGATAAALSCASQVVERMVELAGGEAALHWHDSEERRQGWFARQQVALRLMAGERELGGASAPIFATAPGLERLLRLRVEVEPPPSPDPWWAHAEERGLLELEEPIVEVEGPDNRPELGFHLGMAGRARRTLRPLDLAPKLGAGRSFDELFPVPALPEPPPPITVLSPEEPLPAEPAETIAELELPEPEPPPLPPFDPGWVELPKHRPGSLSVYIDGESVQADLDELAPGILRIQRPEVPHGALLRVDFEPTWRR